MVERIIELSNILKANPKDTAAREELKNIIIPRVEKINEFIVKTGIKIKYFDIKGFDGTVTVEEDRDWDGSLIDNRKSVILKCYEEEFDDYHNTYIDLDYFDKSDEELLEILKNESIRLKRLLIGIKKGRIKDDKKAILELNKEIEKIKNLKL